MDMLCNLDPGELGVVAPAVSSPRSCPPEARAAEEALAAASDERASPTEAREGCNEWECLNATEYWKALWECEDPHVQAALREHCAQWPPHFAIIPEGAQRPTKRARSTEPPAADSEVPTSGHHGDTDGTNEHARVIDSEVPTSGHHDDTDGTNEHAHVVDSEVPTSGHHGNTDGTNKHARVVGVATADQELIELGRVFPQRSLSASQSRSECARRPASQEALQRAAGSQCDIMVQSDLVAATAAAAAAAAAATAAATTTGNAVPQSSLSGSLRANDTAGSPTPQETLQRVAECQCDTMVQSDLVAATVAAAAATTTTGSPARLESPHKVSPHNAFGHGHAENGVVPGMLEDTAIAEEYGALSTTLETQPERSPGVSTRHSRPQRLTMQLRPRRRVLPHRRCRR